MSVKFQGFSYLFRGSMKINVPALYTHLFITGFGILSPLLLFTCCMPICLLLYPNMLGFFGMSVMQVYLFDIL